MDQRKRIGLVWWILALNSLPFLYLLSLGPVAYVHSRGDLPEFMEDGVIVYQTPYENFYAALEDIDLSLAQAICEYSEWYVDLWR